MALFESVLTLLLLAILLLQISRRLAIPYPTMLAAAGLGVAALPWAPAIALDPHLALVLFIAPAILDAAFDFPIDAIRRYWMPLLFLVVVAVLVTTAAVAWVGVVLAGLPVAAAVVLGAIVSPPDAAAAAAMLNRPSMPRSTAMVLRGESLLNDAVALLIFSIGVRIAMAEASPMPVLSQLALAIPGGILLGVVSGRLATLMIRPLAGTLGGIVFQFVATYSTWLIAERLGLSAILAVVATAMTAAHYSHELAPRDRLHTNSVWSLVVFLLNVLAFLFIGLEARAIVSGLDAAALRHALGFGLIVLAVVIVVRIVLVMVYNLAIQPAYRHFKQTGPSVKQGIVASWCGMRGMVTLAAALALPEKFPQRDLIVLSAFTVVLGTLIVQGLTLGPLVRLLKFPPDVSRDDEVTHARTVLAAASRDAGDDAKTAPLTEDDQPESIPKRGLAALRRQRAALDGLRREGRIQDDTFRALQQEIDLEEVAAMRGQSFDLVDT